MSYPEEFLKGIPNQNYIGDDDGPTSDLFYFQKRSDYTRCDGFLEESINWRDDIGADDSLFSQCKSDGSKQFKSGAAILCRIELDRIIDKPFIKNKLSYERRIVGSNRYHGNLLLREEVKPREMKKIAATIATVCVKSVIPNPKEL